MGEYLECLFVDEARLVRVTTQMAAPAAAATAPTPETFRRTSVSFTKQKANF